ncbi:MAG: fibronectin type III domain-containing protein [Opitutaceae bacterium]|jgi:hypothetical protein
MKTQLYGSLLAFGLLSAAFALNAQAAAPVERFTSHDTYYIYYGAWDSTLLSTVQSNGYKVVVVEPKNITRAQVADLQNGADNVSGTADDIRVLGYISFGEDNRTTIYQRDGSGNILHDAYGKPLFNTVSGGTGPRVDPRYVSGTGLLSGASIVSTIQVNGSASAGIASPGGGGYPSYYVDSHLDYYPNGSTGHLARPKLDGKPDSNGEFGGAYVNAGDPAWFTVLKTMVFSTDGNCGLDEILGLTVGKALGCDGIFTDTIDTCAPNSFSLATQFEWTAPGYRQLMKTVRDTYPTKFILQNRGTFFFRTDVEAYNVTTRPYIDGVFFESYYCDSNDFDTKSPYFNDNKYNVGLKISAEADRADGFTVFALDYLEPRATRLTPTIDGAVAEWTAESKLQVNGSPVDTGAINAVYAANDASYLYLRISTDAGTDLNTSNFNLYFDTDDVADDGLDVSAAGYVPTGAGTRIRSELLYQNGGLYSQDTGVFNVGSVGSATVSGNAAKTEWEIRIPRSITHPATHGRYASQPVFKADGTHILMLFTWDTGGTTQYFPLAAGDGFEKNLGYRFEQPTGSVFDSAFVESHQTQGWMLYQTDKFLSHAPNTRAATWNTANADTSAPIWSTTANGFKSRTDTVFEPARTGVQAVVPKDGAVAVQWDTANDQSRPVRYKIYYAPAGASTANLNVSPWANTGYVAGTTPANYAYPRTNATSYANEYTVTGLQNGSSYMFVVHAADSATTVHEDTNVVSLAATPQKSAGSLYANIVIDGAFTDWPAAAQIWGDPTGDKGTGASDIKAIWVANDTDYVYFRIDTWNSHDFPAAVNNLYLDTDLVGGDTTFNPYGANLIFSELLIQGGIMYSQKNGNFNDGMISNVAIVPGSGAATSWEWKIARNTLHPAGVGGGAVFSAAGFKILATSGSAVTDEVAGAATYTFAQPSVFKTITVDGNTSEWPAYAKIYDDPSGDNLGAPTDIKAVWAANDLDYLYLRIETWNTHDMPNAGNNFYFDTDVGVSPGFNPHALGKISSKLLIQSDHLYSEGNGGFNDGALGTFGISPYAVPASNWEYRIPLSLVHPSTAGVRANKAVFGPGGVPIDILLTSDNAGPAEFAPATGALRYVLAGLDIAPQTTAATITVDGNGSDWPSGAKVYDDATGDNAGAPSDIKSVWIANDTNYVYLRIDTWNSHDYAGSFNNTYFDANLSPATGFKPHGLAFGSELLLQNTGVYSQKSGAWNDGAATSPSGKTVTMAPGGGSATTFEWRIPRDLVHPSAGGPVFNEPDGAFFLFVTSDNAGALAERAPNDPGTQFIWYIPAP